MTSTPPIGLLLDVDGPISSTRTRTLRLDRLADDLVAFAAAGCPVVLNTGRSAEFLADQIVPRLVRAGLAPTDPVWGVGEKGGTWFSLEDRDGSAHVGAVHEDHDLAPGEKLVAASREIADEFSDVVFFDDTKRTMISFEQHVEVASEAFLARRPDLIAAIERRVSECGEEKRMSIYPTFIAVDIEHVDSGKALGAQRALELLAERLDPPRRWFTAGDSGQDYDMAEHLHAADYEVTHLDVRLDGEVPDVPYAVIRERPALDDGVAEDDLTARHIARLRAELGI